MRAEAFLRSRVLLGRLFLLVLLATLVGVNAQAQTDTGLVRRLEAEVVRLVAAYPNNTRDSIVAIIASRYARSSSDSAINFLRSQGVARLSSFTVLLSELQAAGRTTEVLSIIEQADDSVTFKEQLRSRLMTESAARSDSTSVLLLLATIPSPSVRLQTAGQLIGFARPEARTSYLVREAQSLLQVFSGRQREIHLQDLAEHAGARGDLTFAASLDSIATDYETYSTLLSRIGGELRRRDDRRADSIYARADNVIRTRLSGVIARIAVERHLSYYMPPLSDENPLRHLPRAGTGYSRIEYVRNVLAIHLSNNSTKIPLRVLEDLLRRRDTTLAMQALVSAYSRPWDVPWWPPLGTAESFRELHTRLQPVVASMPNGQLQNSLTILSERFMNPARQVFPSENLSANPDSVLLMVPQVPDSVRRVQLTRSAARALAERGRMDDAIRAADLLSPQDRLALQLYLIGLPGGNDDATRTVSILRESLTTLDPERHFNKISGDTLVPLLFANGMRDDAIRWAEGLPENKRAFAFVWLLRTLWNNR